MTQTTYNLNRQRAFTGLVADSRIPTSIVTATAGEALNWGDAVYVSDWSEGEQTIVVNKLNAANKENLFGFVAFEQRQRNSSDITLSKDQDVPILLQGAIWVDNTAAAVAGGSKLVVKSSDAMFDDTSASGDVTYHGILFLSAGAAENAMVKILVNLPGYSVTQ